MANETKTASELADSIKDSFQNIHAALMELVVRNDISSETRDWISKLNDVSTDAAHVAIELRRSIMDFKK